MRLYLRPPSTHSHQILAVLVFHCAPLIHVIQNAEKQKDNFLTSSLWYSIGQLHLNVTHLPVEDLRNISYRGVWILTLASFPMTPGLSESIGVQNVAEEHNTIELVNLNPTHKGFLFVCLFCFVLFCVGFFFFFFDNETSLIVQSLCLKWTE